LASGGKLKVEKKGTATILEFPASALQTIDTVVEIRYSGDIMQIKPMDIKAESLSFNKTVTASSNPDQHWRGVKSIVNGDWSGHFWMPADDDKAPWAEIDLGKPEKLSKAVIYESGDPIKAFEIQYLKDNTWTTACTGSRIGSMAGIKLPGITAQKVRLVLKEFSNTPGIYEFVLL
jgi:hypothetical protein